MPANKFDPSLASRMSNILSGFRQNTGREIKLSELISNRPARLAASFVYDRAEQSLPKLHLSDRDAREQMFTAGLVLGVYLSECGLAALITRESKPKEKD